jgi:salicylate hydroxylase
MWLHFTAGNHGMKKSGSSRNKRIGSRAISEVGVRRLPESSRSVIPFGIYYSNLQFQLLDTPDVWAIFDSPQVPTFHKGRLCLLSDLAYATSPHYGQGAGMAVEDAYVLSNLFAVCKSPSDIKRAFDAYDFVRVPRALRVTSMSRKEGKVLDMEGDGIRDDLEKIAKSLDITVRWIWNKDLEAHLGKAMDKF